MAEWIRQQAVIQEVPCCAPGQGILSSLPSPLTRLIMVPEIYLAGVYGECVLYQYQIGFNRAGRCERWISLTLSSDPMHGIANNVYLYQVL